MLSRQVTRGVTTSVNEEGYGHDQGLKLHEVSSL